MLRLTRATARATGPAEASTALGAAMITATMATVASCVRLNRRLTCIGTLLRLDGRSEAPLCLWVKPPTSEQGGKHGRNNTYGDARRPCCAGESGNGVAARFSRGQAHVVYASGLTSNPCAEVRLLPGPSRDSPEIRSSRSARRDPLRSFEAFSAQGCWRCFLI